MYTSAIITLRGKGTAKDHIDRNDLLIKHIIEPCDFEIVDYSILSDEEVA